MRAVCAWCEREGKETVLKPGPKDGPLSHGICDMHERWLIDQALGMRKKRMDENPFLKVKHRIKRRKRKPTRGKKRK